MDQGMNKADYFAIKNQISFDKPLWITLALIVIDLGILATALYFLTLGSLPAFIAAQFLLTLFYFHNFGILHEAGHGNVHHDRWINTVIGHYSSMFCFMPYFPWKLIHQEHHVWAGNIDKDPTMANLKKMREQKKVSWLVNFAWRSWIPLAALLQHFVFWLYPLTMWETGKMNMKSFLQSLFSVGLIASFYYLAFTLFPNVVNLQNLWPSLIMYLMVTELVNLPHHVNLPTFHTSEKRNKLHPWEQNVTTRSCHYPYGLSALFTLNFSYHTEHHFFPNLPWYRLPHLRSILKPKLAGDYNEVIGIGWNLANRSRDANDIVLPEIQHPIL
jgi:fatty acid desaturase